MANQVVPRLTGEQYQHLYSWMQVLELKMPRRHVRLVTVEDALAASFDDVTVQHEPGTADADHFFQVKYHTDQRGAYSTDALLARTGNESSLLQKFWRSWQTLKAQDRQRPVELHLVSNWAWDPTDKVRECIGGRNNSLQEPFYSATGKRQLARLRERWRSHLGAATDEFRSFLEALRFDLGFQCYDELTRRIAERMENLGLKHDETALLLAAGIVREWIMAGRQEISLAELEATLAKHDLYLPEEAEHCVTIYLTTIKDQKFDLEPDHLLDWREHFLGGPHKKGHQLKDPSEWNARLLPELLRLEAQVNQETDCRLVRARGLARLSAWCAFGHVFSEVARYTIEVDQNGRLWRTDAKASPDFRLRITSTEGSPDGETLDGEGETVAVGVSVTGELDQDVRSYLTERKEKVAALLLVRPERELGRECLRSASDAVALADGVKTCIRSFVKKRGARRLLLFYFGPLSGACFLGHRLNAICQEIQIMEDQQPGYAPSFLLT